MRQITLTVCLMVWAIAVGCKSTEKATIQNKTAAQLTRSAGSSSGTAPANPAKAKQGEGAPQEGLENDSGSTPEYLKISGPF